MLDRIAYWRVASIPFPASQRSKKRDKKVGENIVENKRRAARIKAMEIVRLQIAYIFGGSPLAFSST